MRIQHNIMAMNAYRNYSNNVSAMQKNLEKLSSGYKINRAGDDAAGLAISEKMRAQISGLEAAQKNAKDGISLVQTAEGALTEVHDMLNRMVTLATQSANGTYDNDTDRYQLQKEVNQLVEEINRIADSSNFNGIKLLDGSMATDAAKITGDARIINDVYTSGNAAALSGTKTFLDGEVGTNATNTVFEVDFTGLTAKDGNSPTATKAVYESAEIKAADIQTNAATDSISIGGKTIAVTSTDTIDTLITKLSDTTDGVGTDWTVEKDGDDIKFTAKTANTAKTLAGATQVTEGSAETAATGSITLNDGDTFTFGGETYEKGTANANAGNDTNYSVSFDKDTGVVTFTAKTAGAAGNGEKTIGGKTVTMSGGKDNATAVYKLADAADAIKTATEGSKDLTIDSKKYDVTGADLKAQLTSWAAAYNADTANTEWEASVNADGNKIVYTAKTAGALGTTGATAPAGTEVIPGADAPASTVDFTFTIGGKAITVNAAGGNTLANGEGADEIAAAVLAAIGTEVEINGINYTVAASTDTSKIQFTLKDDPTDKNIAANYDWDVKGLGEDSFDGNHTAGVTVTTAGAAHKDAPVANTVFRLEANDIKDGAKITIDGTTVTLAVGKNSAYKNELANNGAGTVAAGTGTGGFIDLTWMEESNVDLNKAISAISEGFAGSAGNGNWIVGVNDTSNKDTHPGLTVHKSDTNTGVYDTKAKLAAIFGIEKEAGKGLTLQIGDTADTYNQLNVSITDCHAASLGISGVDISTQEGAQEAVNAIKAAINKVSDVRGTLGATQNRLDHTINNLSVMTENIQDAESTIRDVDVAEEMMAYTKNNILIQSAQAMLAQANQVPQGVLQLLG